MGSNPAGVKFLSKVFNFLGDILLGHRVFDYTIIHLKTDWPENFVKYTWKKTKFFLKILDHEFSESSFHIFFRGKNSFNLYAFLQWLNRYCHVVSINLDLL